MKNTLKFCALYLFVLFAGSSCQMDVSLTPDSFRPASFSTEAQMDAQIAGLYAVLATDRTYGQGLWGYLVSATDEGFRSGVNNTTINQPAMYNCSSADKPYSDFWKDMYQGIERANVILNVIDGIDMPVVKKKAYKGEALFLRAYYYYLLVSNFGDVPLKTKITDDMGTNFDVPRAPAKDVYAYILNDMVAADTLVKTKAVAGSPSIVTKTAVESVLARVCLSMAGNPVNDISKYQDALTWSQKVINSGSHSLNVSDAPSLDPIKFPGASTTPAYSRLFIANMQNSLPDANNKEAIWEAAFLSKSNTSGTYSGTGYPVVQQLGSIMGVMCKDVNAPTSIVGYSDGSYRVFPHLFNLYAEGDLRRDWAIAPYVYKAAPFNARTLFYNITFGGPGTGAKAGTPIVSSTGAIISIPVANGGSGYTTAPTVFINNAYSGSSAKAVAVVAGGAVTAINVTVAGSAYPTAYDRPVGKWRREYETNLPSVREKLYTSCNFPIIRYADVLLMAAEADLMVNSGTPSAAAVENYNKVRRRAYGATPPADAITITLQDIKDERSRELCFEGVRRQDLIRWGDYATAMATVLADNTSYCPATYKYAADVSAANYNPLKHNLFPIPDYEMRTNRALVQNPNW
jgi:starch-binding outer membrane protein, SusD/RagB family